MRITESSATPSMVNSEEELGCFEQLCALIKSIFFSIFCCFSSSSSESQEHSLQNRTSITPLNENSNSSNRANFQPRVKFHQSLQDDLKGALTSYIQQETNFGDIQYFCVVYFLPQFPPRQNVIADFINFKASLSEGEKICIVSVAYHYKDNQFPPDFWNGIKGETAFQECDHLCVAYDFDFNSGNPSLVFERKESV
jgi:hypothetical protein